MSLRLTFVFAPFLAIFCNAVLAAPTSGSAAADGEVLLSRGDVSVTRADLMYMIETSFPESARATVIADNKRVREIIADIFTIRMLAAEARQGGLADDPSVRFRAAIQEDRALMEALLDKAVNAAGSPDLEKLAKERYIANPEQFEQPEQVRASHILIGPKEGRTREQAKALAEDVRKQAMEGKKSFEDLALEYSDDQSAKTNKGDLGFFPRNRMVKPFADAVFAMNKPGEIGPLVESQFGYHVIKYVDRKPERQLGFDEVKAKMIDLERQKFASQVRMEKIEAVRSLDGITVNQDAVSAISAKKAAP